jgi:hypothetical protein
MAKSTVQALFLLLCVSTSLAAQPQPPSTAPGSPQAESAQRRMVRAVRLQPGERIVLDGRLDDEA